jgi:hypothetical protein
MPRVTMQISYTLAADDFRSVGRLTAARLKQRQPPGFQWSKSRYRWAATAITVGVLLALGALFLSTQYDWIDNNAGVLSILTLLGGLMAGTTLVVLLARGAEIELVRPNGPLTGGVLLTASDERLAVELPLLHRTFEWEAIESLSKHDDYIVLWLEPCFVEFIPRRAFSTPQQRDEFCNFVEARISGGNSSAQGSSS